DVSTAGDWSYNLDTSELDEGTHTIDFRSYDGLYYSDINASSFEVRSPGPPPDDDDDGFAIGWYT
ncbi:MAG: hypothetical protein GWN18_07080, partial [Thermoplasmata archaeon]|nr:hypothetical protein [Thermoplasmata archaeon]NIS11834.1 hypothetical protein [Thermoplasmata archaeon]NIS19727.1 hypothetical protein [Thermoplasmata archaeon]NIT76913.1 hypothetical protein [Thermoplasmata archaeon]NIU48838.1 hypothetical protein [Thermoplasmata archaeon]